MTGPSRWARLLCCLMLWTAAAGWAPAADTPIAFTDAAEATRFRTLATRLRCLVCQNQSIEDSHAPLAQDLRKEVLRLMREGRSDADIEAFLTQRYGDFVLYAPRVKPLNYALWFGPLVLLLAALAWAWRRWRRAQSRAAESLDDAERQRAWALLEAGGSAGSVAPPRPAAERPSSAKAAGNVREART